MPSTRPRGASRRRRRAAVLAAPDDGGFAERAEPPLDVVAGTVLDASPHLLILAASTTGVVGRGTAGGDSAVQTSGLAVAGTSMGRHISLGQGPAGGRGQDRVAGRHERVARRARGPRRVAARPLRDHPAGGGGAERRARLGRHPAGRRHDRGVRAGHRGGGHGSPPGEDSCGDPPGRLRAGAGQASAAGARLPDRRHLRADARGPAGGTSGHVAARVPAGRPRRAGRGRGRARGAARDGDVVRERGR